MQQNIPLYILQWLGELNPCQMLRWNVLLYVFVHICLGHNKPFWNRMDNNFLLTYVNQNIRFDWLNAVMSRKVHKDWMVIYRLSYLQNEAYGSLCFWIHPDLYGFRYYFFRETMRRNATLSGFLNYICLAVADMRAVCTTTGNLIVNRRRDGPIFYIGSELERNKQ